MKFLLTLSTLAVAASLQAGPTKLLNVSYDVTREFYQDYNAAFVKHWQGEKKDALQIDVSHAGSSKQARSVVDGLAADVVTMNQDSDIQLIANAGLIAKDWRERLPDHAAPYTSTIVFLVHAGNPKGIKDWNDLIKPDTQVVIPNPKTSGNGRYSYLAAWAYAQAAGTKPEEFVRALFKNVPLLPAGGRDATNAFVQRGIGDVLLTFESEALQIARTIGAGQYEIVTPSSSVLAEAPVSVVDKIVDKNGTREVAAEYLKYLWSDEGQQLAVKHFFRPRSQALLDANPELFPKLKLVTVDDAFGGWSEAQKHFKDGGTFDAIYQPAKP